MASGNNMLCLYSIHQSTTDNQLYTNKYKVQILNKLIACWCAVYM